MEKLVEVRERRHFCCENKERENRDFIEGEEQGSGGFVRFQQDAITNGRDLFVVKKQNG